MICLGIESSAHTFGIGIVDSEGKILSNQKSVYIPPLGKGIIPQDAAKFHKENSEKILKSALNKAKLTFKDIDIIAYTAGAGLPPCLLVGANFATDLSKKYKKKLVPVCHQIAHLEIGRLFTKTKDPIFVYLSGGNTQIIAFVEGIYRIFGETQDIPLGNCLDIVAREMGLQMPGGLVIEKLAKSGKYVVKGMDVSFSGISTAAIQLFRKGLAKEDIAYSLQETCFAMLVEVSERAVAHTGKKEVLLVGGVAANIQMQEMMNKMCEEREAKMYVVPNEYSGDNGAMIAWTGLISYKNKKIPKVKDKIIPKWRIDQVEWNQK
jgi:glycoprotease/Kae1 family metallohydrolase